MILSYLFKWPLLAFGLLLGVAGSALAESRPVFDTPLYEPTTQSYFELVTVKKEEKVFSVRQDAEVRWEVAEQLARKRMFKGRRGRLAVVRSYEVYTFLLREFRTDLPAWIGLRYFCADRQLRWTSGATFKKGDFQAWHPKWDQSVPNSGCIGTRGGERPFMPVSFTSAADGFRWTAVGGIKEYRRYFVEYPVSD